MKTLEEKLSEMDLSGVYRTKNNTYSDGVKFANRIAGKILLMGDKMIKANKNDEDFCHAILTYQAKINYFLKN